MGTPPGARRALIEYRKPPGIGRPIAVDVPPQEAAGRSRAGRAADGVVTIALPEGTELAEGEVFLRGGHHVVYRFSWKAGDNDRCRALPEVTYQVTGYRVARVAKDGTSWRVSTTSPGYRKVAVKAGEATALAIDPTVGFEVESRVEGGKIRGSAAPWGERLAVRDGADLRVGHERRIGLTIYRDGKRIPLAFGVLDKEGKVLETGGLAYG
jgi:hypothetical protein